MRVDVGCRDTRTVLGLFVVFVLALLLSGCSYDGDSGESPEETHNYSLRFDGRDDYATIRRPRARSFPEWTIALWAKPRQWVSDTQGIQQFVTASHTDTAPDNPRRNFHLRNYQGGLLQFTVSSPRERPSNGLKNQFNLYRDDPLGWHHLAVSQETSSGGERVNTLFFDGKVVSRDTGPYPELKYEFWIGSKSGKGSFYRGHLDDLRLWDSPLEVRQVAAVADGESPVAEDSLVGSWNFNRGDRVMILDEVGGVDGTLYGSGWSEDTP